MFPLLRQMLTEFGPADASFAIYINLLKYPPDFPFCQALVPPRPSNRAATPSTLPIKMRFEHDPNFIKTQGAISIQISVEESLFMRQTDADKLAHRHDAVSVVIGGGHEVPKHELRECLAKVFLIWGVHRLVDMGTEREGDIKPLVWFLGSGQGMRTGAYI